MDDYAAPKLIVPDERLVMEANPDGTCATFSIAQEDHTVGNALRHMLAKSRSVEFVGYSIPHPSEAKLNLRVQTHGADYHAIDCVKEALSNLIDMSEHIRDTYQNSLQEYMENDARM
jgi:DNA-directed RNA polymerase I and III subunit RPAC2